MTGGCRSTRRSSPGTDSPFPTRTSAMTPATGRWEIGEIDWTPLRATLDNLGPDSARRIGDAAGELAATRRGFATR